MAVTPDFPVPDQDTDFDSDTVASIVDTVLGLDELLSADVRRAEDTHRFFRRADLQAEINDLSEQLASITDELGRTLDTVDASLGEDNAARTLALKIQQLRRDYYAASGVVRLRQMESDEWEGFRTTWKDDLNKAAGPGLKMWNALIAKTVIQPDLTVDAVIKMRTIYGAPAMDTLAQKCWDLNAEAGVSVPKSLSSSLVLARLARETN